MGGDAGYDHNGRKKKKQQAGGGGGSAETPGDGGGLAERFTSAGGVYTLFLLLHHEVRGWRGGGGRGERGHFLFLLLRDKMGGVDVPLSTVNRGSLPVITLS